MFVSIGNDVQLSVPDDASVSVVSRGIRLDLAKRIVARVEKILPVVSSVLTAWRTPFYEEKVTSVRVIAW